MDLLIVTRSKAALIASNVSHDSVISVWWETRTSLSVPNAAAIKTKRATRRASSGDKLAETEE